MKLDLISNKKQSGFIYGNTNNEPIGILNPNDEYYTHVYAIEPIAKYLKPNSVIWCPFDTEKSNYVRYLRARGHSVFFSHQENGGDFFKFEPKHEYDYIISNPPYSVKYEVFKRLFELDKPFAMLVGVVGIFESKKRFNLFKDNKFEIMYFDKRISYFKDYEKPNDTKLNPPFSSVYICSRILPQQILFEELNRA